MSKVHNGFHPPGYDPETCGACKTHKPALVDTIKAGDRVTIRVYNGGGTAHPEYKPKTGRAVMRGPAGWVLNMGGRHGTPDIAHNDNIVKVKKGRKEG